MKVMIMGMDGYLGWPLSMHLSSRGHEVSGVDNLSRRKNVNETGSWSATPIKTMNERRIRYKEVSGKDLTFYRGDLVEPSFTDLVVKKEMPDCIVHLGEIPSAPYSMIDVDHCNYTQNNNIIGNNNILFAMKDHVPNCHLLKLGTMGEYGTPNLDIPEGFFEIEYRGRKDKLPYPRQPGSWYHLAKVHETWNIMFANKIWGLRATDVMQGVVHGVLTDDMETDDLITRFDFDEVWGTAINRFCAQAVVGHDVTPYGKGGQTRGYLALRDSMQCFTLAVENPPDETEYRVFNQFDETYSVNALAEIVSKVAKEYDLEGKIRNIPNPRLEAEKHRYEPDMKHLPALGFKPKFNLEDELRITLPKLIEYKDRIEAKRDKIKPKIFWSQ
ncbi:NAD-dependent epimerase/dehydratase family protein [Candidatus Bathyarchaeota archaeon]|jgi:UDP-sulfoquinovose synthase|nr:NAD-dependent epimerase/dehydratase family protein [Candidatus Bathyarchaeota archaeon]MBT4090703.1 NAD-dependent epimerase/dehydratase family protein [Deltaproteobacteria bacterium]MBT4321170.1 NAD-dependent epimerase/dehydratase family protein [Candidatus Bathyarchaeota archaeon]MBT4424533.1 NAD-dependent epimerase/dehydratase family protein [Candidatus Bathyarchaeota archaeon]MBT5641672.1 NAD-dependent epimerase/dehydratase family protein [Candidatus Bathyarchaeota archaeon]